MKLRLILGSHKMFGLDIDMKVCSKCKESKEVSGFYKNKTQKDGYQNYCKKCMNSVNTDWQKRNKEKAKQYTDTWRKENDNHVKLVAKEWRQNNKGCVASHSAKRRNSKFLRTPSWLSLEQLKSIQLEYELAAWCSDVTGTLYHVDHIIPLRGKLVSGLHVPWNLQVIQAIDNLSKGNRI